MKKRSPRHVNELILVSIAFAAILCIVGATV